MYLYILWIQLLRYVVKLTSAQKRSNRLASQQVVVANVVCCGGAGFGYLGKAAFHPGSHLRIGFPGCISYLLLIAPPHPLLLVPHQLDLPLRWLIYRHLQLTVVGQGWLLEPRACGVRECAPTEWHLHEPATLNQWKIKEMGQKEVVVKSVLSN